MPTPLQSRLAAEFRRYNEEADRLKSEARALIDKRIFDTDCPAWTDLNERVRILERAHSRKLQRIMKSHQK